MFLSKGFKNLSENTVKTLFSGFKFSKYFRQRHRLLIMQNYFTQEISFSYLLIKTLQNLRQVFIFHIFTCRNFAYFGSIVVRDFCNFQIFNDNQVHNHKVKKIWNNQNFQTLTFLDKQHCVENHKHQILLGFNLNAFPLTCFRSMSQQKPI